MKLTLVRQDTGATPPDAARSALRVLLQYVNGMGEQGRRQVERFMYGLLDLEPGELVNVTTEKRRVGWRHRKHMALESALFDAQGVFENFEQFRHWLKVGAGLCDYFPGVSGMVAVPRSISFAEMEEDDFVQFDEDMKAFLRGRGCEALWPMASRRQQVQNIERILTAFERPREERDAA